MIGRGRIGLVIIGVGALVVAVANAAPAQPSGDAERLLSNAQNANAHQSYAGILSVDWSDASRAAHHAEAVTHVVDGQVEIGDGPNRILSDGDQRWVGAPGAWSLVVGGTNPGSPPPSPDANWDLRTEPGPSVAGRATTVVVATDPSTGTPRARFFIDAANGTMLRRDVLDRRGRLLRDVRFEALLPLGETPTPTQPRTAKPDAPSTLPSVPSGYDAPKSIGRGFRLLGRYRQPDGTVQLYYGDGIFTLSLFEQPGTIDWGSLPDGTSVDVNGDSARVYETPTSSVAVWSHRGLVVTAVSDAAPDQVLGAVRATDHGGGGGVLHDVAHFVLGPFGWG